MGKAHFFWLWCWTCAVLGLRAQEVEWNVEVVGMAGRPYLWSEVMPLTGVSVPRASGSIGMDGRVVLNWPDDDRLHFCELQCAGVVWTLPVAGPAPVGHRLVPLKAGGGPFAARPGAVAVDPSATRGVPLAIADYQKAKADVEAGLGAELQRRMLWNGTARRGGEARALGEAIGDGAGAAENVASDSLRRALTSELGSLPPAFSAGHPPALRAWMEADIAGPCMDADPAMRDAARQTWASMASPDPADVVAVQQFVNGAQRFATVAALPDSLVDVCAKGIGSGDWEALVTAGAGWWNRRDEDMTAAWCAFRLGRDAFGVRRSGRPFAGRTWSPSWQDIFDRLVAHPLYGAEVSAWSQSDTPVAQLPGDLRAFDAAENLIDLESVVGSGPALWLWIDASAPSTTVQLQVLERMLADPQFQRVARGLQWVVADAGMDWEAHQRLVRAVSKRYGGLNRVPFRMLHVGGDVRWTKAFELSALPAVRHHGPDRIPVAAELPLPGPELSRWLAKRP